jgi:hypothetical protein
MAAGAAIPADSVAVSGARQTATLNAFRDDGPVARALGTLVRSVPVPAATFSILALAVLVGGIVVGGGDDASTGTAIAVVVGALALNGLASGPPQRGRLAWMSPFSVRVVEYASVVWLASVAGSDALPAAFAQLGATAFRHYDIVYRLRHQGAAPPAWLSLALGWDVRVLVACLLVALDAVPTGMFVFAAVLGAVFVTESVRSWMTFTAQLLGTGEDEDEVEE